MAQELLENGYVTGRPYLGISYYAVTDAQTAAQLGVNAYGVYIVEVVKGGPADKAGLQAGDRIVSVDGSEVATQSDLGTLMQNHKAGDAIEITVARGGQMQTVTVTLGEKVQRITENSKKAVARNVQQPFCCENTLGKRSRPLRLLTTFAATSPKGRGKSTAGSFFMAPHALVMNFTAWLPLRGSWRGSA